MVPLLIFFISYSLQCAAEDYYYNPFNVTRTSLSRVAAYRSALTLDWLANEDDRQRELAVAFETASLPTPRVLRSDCMSYPKPASGKVARLMLELLKNLEGDEGTIISDLIQALVRSKLLVESSMLDAETDLEALVKTPGLMRGAPHVTFPRVLGMLWMAATDSITTKRHGWCPITRVTKYLTVTHSVTIAQQVHHLDPVFARAKFIMEEFIQHVTPINVYDSRNFGYSKKLPRTLQVERTAPIPQLIPSRTPPYDNQLVGLPIKEIDPLENLIGNGELRTESGARQLENCMSLVPIGLCMYFSNVFEGIL